METRCEICGCLTEEEQLTDYSLAGEQVRICSYCKKRLEMISDCPGANTEQARNMYSMDNPHRKPETQKALERFFGSLGISLHRDEVPVVPLTGEMNSDERLRQLEERIKKLEDKVETFRRRYLISKAMGVLIPIILVLIVFLIMVASGALTNLVKYYNMIMEYANM